MIGFAELESRVRTLFEAESSARWESADFLDAVNDGLDELSEATGFYERFAPIPLKGKQFYYDLRGFVPKGFLRVNNVYYPDQSVWLDPVDITYLRETDRYETIEGIPQRYVMRGAFWLGLCPRPSGDTGVARVYYSGMAPHLTGNESVVSSDLPDDFIPALEDYALYELSAWDGDVDKSLAHWSSYYKREAALLELVKERISSARSGRLGGQ